MTAALLAAVTLSAANAIPVAFAYGVGSAFIPVLNAEVFVAAAVAAMRHAWWWPVIALAVGQTLGKCLMFLGARRGATWFQGRERRPAADRGPGPWRARIALWSRLMLELLDRPVQGFAVVLLAASVGIPPLAVVSVVAGTRKLPFPLFVLACGIGRIGRFLTIAWPVAAALR